MPRGDRVFDRATVDATIELPADVSAPATARRWIRERAQHLPPVLVNDALLLCSELVTNAVQHGLPVIVLSLSLHPPGIGIAVQDGGDGAPPEHPTTPPDDQTSGRGLHIVDTLATAWGIERESSTVGKIVWFELRP